MEIQAELLHSKIAWQPTNYEMSWNGEETTIGETPYFAEQSIENGYLRFTAFAWHKYAEETSRQYGSMDEAKEACENHAVTGEWQEA